MAGGVINDPRRGLLPQAIQSFLFPAHGTRVHLIIHIRIGFLFFSHRLAVGGGRQHIFGVRKAGVYLILAFFLLLAHPFNLVAPVSRPGWNVHTAIFLILRLLPIPDHIRIIYITNSTLGTYTRYLSTYLPTPLHPPVTNEASFPTRIPFTAALVHLVSIGCRPPLGLGSGGCAAFLAHMQAARRMRSIVQFSPRP